MHIDNSERQILIYESGECWASAIRCRLHEDTAGNGGFTPKTLSEEPSRNANHESANSVNDHDAQLLAKSFGSLNELESALAESPIAIVLFVIDGAEIESVCEAVYRLTLRYSRARMAIVVPEEVDCDISPLLLLSPLMILRNQRDLRPFICAARQYFSRNFNRPSL